MADNAIASGSVVLTANADKMTDGFKKAEAETKKASERMNNALTKPHDKGGLGGWAEHESKKLKGKFNEALMGGAIGGFLGSSMEGVVHEFVETIRESVNGTKALEHSVKEMVKGLEKSVELTNRSVGLAKEWRDALPDHETGRKTRIESLDKEMRDRTKTISELEAQLAKPIYPGQAAPAKEMSAYYDAMDKYKMLQKNGAAELNQQLAEQKQGVTKAAEEMGRLMDRATDPTFVGEIEKATFAIRMQAETWGKDEAAAQRYMFTVRGGTDKLLEGLDKEAARLKAVKEAAEEHARSVERSTLDRSSNAMLGVLNGILRDPRRLDQMEYRERAGNASMSRLGSLLAMGMAASEKALKPVLDQAGSKSMAHDFAAAVEAGTKEAYSLRIRNQFPGSSPGGQPNKVEDAKLRQGVDQMNNRLDQIRDAIRGALGGIGVV